MLDLLIKINGEILQAKFVKAQGDYIVVTIDDGSYVENKKAFRFPNALHNVIGYVAYLFAHNDGYYDFDAYRNDVPKWSKYPKWRNKRATDD